MSFLIKKLISAFALPLTWALLLLAAGLVLLWWTRRQRAGRVLVSLSLAVLYIFSIRPTALLLLSPLENRHPAYAARHADFVVVLGGGQYSDASCERLSEGIRIWRANPGSRLVLSGAACGERVSEAEVLADCAVSLGVPPNAVVREPCSRDTSEHPGYVKSIVGGRPFALVTSASHMPRALAMFRKAGLSPIPAPAGYLSLRLARTGRFALSPSATALSASSAALHEYLGLLWARLRGQI